MQVIIILSSFLLLLGIAHAELATSLENGVLSKISKAAQVASTVTTSTGIRARRSHTSQRLSINEFNQCQNIAHRVVCESGLQQQLYNLALGCRQQELADIARFGCAVNDNGVYCSRGVELSQEFAAETSSRCFSITSCSSSCRSSISNIRDRLGCCSGYWTPLNSSRQSNFDGELWQTCGVSTSELCPLPTFTTPNDTTRFCTETEAARILLSQRCTQNSSGITVETLANTTGCGGVAKLHVEICDTNSNGDFCALNGELTLAMAMIRNCAGSVNGGTCSFSCRQSMFSLRNALGCCINTLYNGTSTRIAPLVPNADLLLSFFTNSFWSRCGVSPPGACDSTLLLPEIRDNGGVKMSGMISVVLMFTLTALLL